MNKVNVLNVAKSIFSNIQPINDNVFKGELFVNSNKPAGVFYFDFTENIDDINFNEYQEKILSEEYFKVRNNLQWNYYYLFFQDRIDKKKKCRF